MKSRENVIIDLCRATFPPGRATLMLVMVELTGILMEESLAGLRSTGSSGYCERMRPESHSSLREALRTMGGRSSIKRWIGSTKFALGSVVK
jgi:hypothetical protein